MVSFIELQKLSQIYHFIARSTSLKYRMMWNDGTNVLGTKNELKMSGGLPV